MMICATACPHCSAVGSVFAERVRIGRQRCRVYHCGHCNRRWLAGRAPRVLARRRIRLRRSRMPDGPIRLRHRSTLSLFDGQQWDLVVSKRISVFLTGPPLATREFIEKLEPRLLDPVMHVACDRQPALRGLETDGTVVLHDIDRLGLNDQEYVLDWLEIRAGRTQVVSTSSRSVLPLIAMRSFLDTLYYRLNTVYFELTGPPAQRQERFVE
jgi:hypothetical protein